MGPTFRGPRSSGSLRGNGSRPGGRENHGISTSPRDRSYRVARGHVPWQCLRREKLNKSELIDTVAGSTGEAKRAVSDVIEATLNTIQKQVKKGDKVTIPGFGTFSRRNRAAEIVTPERETPGIRARACAHPIPKPAQRLRSAGSRSCGRRSASQSTAAKTASRIAICHGSPRWSAITCSPSAPTSAAGIVATRTIHASR